MRGPLLSILVVGLLLLVPSAVAGRASEAVGFVDASCRREGPLAPAWFVLPTPLANACGTAHGDPGYEGVKPCTRNHFIPGSTAWTAYEAARAEVRANGGCESTIVLVWGGVNATDPAVEYVAGVVGSRVCWREPVGRAICESVST